MLMVPAVDRLVHQLSNSILLSSVNSSFTTSVKGYMHKILVVIAFLSVWTTSIRAETIAVIGTGDVGGALGPEFATLGHQVIYGSRNPGSEKVAALVQRTGHGALATTPQEATLKAEIVVLAVPGMLVKEIVASLGDLSEKIIIDPTNPLTRREDGKLGIKIDGSNAEIIQSGAPGASVVKAFNTLGWRTMIHPERAGGPVSIPLVGDNSEAKARVAEIVSSMGLEPIDVGPLRNARHVEGMSVLLLNNALGDGANFEFHLRQYPVQ
jgi:predicted dinucleotide-binding enzyme